VIELDESMILTLGGGWVRRTRPADEGPLNGDMSPWHEQCHAVTDRGAQAAG
jgi:hypothetical protein